MTDETITSYQLSHYKILEKLGEGGMGVVYKAQDLRLDRVVALKFLPPHFGREEEQKKRFIQEAKAASALDHPNICTIHEIDETGEGHLFIAMAYYEGETLKNKIERGPLPVPEALDLALQVAQGLAKAHGQGLVHRDVKPANVIVTRDGVAKIVDFGLAKMADSTELTKTGTTMGTAAYMSPEQAQGEHVDSRTDVWSLGVVLYEMLTGQRPFRGDHVPSLVYAVVHEKPKPITSVRAGLPTELERVVARALEKDRGARYPSAAELAKDLADYRSSLSASQTRPIDLRLLIEQSKRPRVAVPALLILLLLAAATAWLVQRGSKARWAREQALPEIGRLVDAEKYPAAFTLARQAEKYLPAADPTLAGFWSRMSRTVAIQTTPPGADVYFREYSAADSPWEYTGRSPLERLRVPRGLLRWKVEKKGFQTVERGIGGIYADAFAPIALTLDEEASAPPGMVRVSGGNAPYALVIPGFEHIAPVPLQDYWIDKYEVTNKQFKEFVDRGCYQKQEYWKEKFVKDGRTLSWQEAIAQFRDATGRPGPTTWELGDYARGQDDYPVTGISWYEAAAYAEFAGKSLPTIFHWNKAAVTGTAWAVVPLSNFAGQGPARIGTYPGMNAFGTYDMAGNVKEWCWNGTGDGKRYILGGAWNEPVYMFTDADARSPFDRSANFGFRCVRYASSEAVAKPGTDDVLSITNRDFEKEKPVSDEVFRAYRSLYSYDKTPLNPAVESVDESDPGWKKEKVTFAAAYGNERVAAYLFLPKKSAPPYQTIVFFPGSGVISLRSSKELRRFDLLDFLLQGGRAVMFPIYKGTYERGDDLKSDVPDTTSFYRDHMIMWSKDLGRSLDYLESRPEIDRNKIGYYGFSWGSQVSPAMIVMESRIKVAVLGVGGFCFQKALPEADMINFVSRVKTPVLMLNGRYDFFFPIETSQKPLFRLLGTPKENKRHILYESGHNIPRTELIKETLDWLDRYLGPVK
ncbi:MAG: protein kinase [Acidobacteria bacterium]|nr:protein kinase [Acidobacteriota bacterium]